MDIKLPTVSWSDVDQRSESYNDYLDVVDESLIVILVMTFVQSKMAKIINMPIKKIKIQMMVVDHGGVKKCQYSTLLYKTIFIAMMRFYKI